LLSLNYIAVYIGTAISQLLDNWSNTAYIADRLSRVGPVNIYLMPHLKDGYPVDVKCYNGTKGRSGWI